MSCALHQTSKMLVQGRYMNANHFGNFSLGVGTSRVQFNCLHHLFLGPLLNLFILMSTVGVPFDLVVFLPLYSLVLTSFLAMFNLGKTCVSVVSLGKLGLGLGCLACCLAQFSSLIQPFWIYFAHKNGKTGSLSAVDIDITHTQCYQEEQFEHRTQSTLSESLKIFTLLTELKYCSNKATYPWQAHHIYYTSSLSPIWYNYLPSNKEE